MQPRARALWCMSMMNLKTTPQEYAVTDLSGGIVAWHRLEADARVDATRRSEDTGLRHDVWPRPLGSAIQPLKP